MSTMPGSIGFDLEKAIPQKIPVTTRMTCFKMARFRMLTDSVTLRGESLYDIYFFIPKLGGGFRYLCVSNK